MCRHTIRKRCVEPTLRDAVMVGWVLSMEMDDEPVEPGAEVESAHTTARMSARSQRIEVITRGERRRRWSVEQKREIAAESLEPGISPITVARRYSISSGQLYTWRRHLLEDRSGPRPGRGQVRAC